MKHSIFVKFLVILLASLSILTAVACSAGIYAMESADLYANGIHSLQDQQYDILARSIAKSYATWYAVESEGNLSYSMMQSLYTDPESRSDTQHWTVSLSQGDNLLVEPKELPNCSFAKSYTITSEYPIALYPQEQPGASDSESSDEPPTPTVPTGYLYRRSETFWHDGQWDSYELYYYEAPEYTVTVYLQEEALNNSSLDLLTGLFPYRYTMITGLALGLIFGAASVVYFCWSAGRATDGSIRPGGLSLFPLDIYAALIAVGLYAVMLLYSNLSRFISNEGLHPGSLSFLALLLLAAILLCIAFVYSLAAQLKMGAYYWWYHSLTGFLLTWIYRGLRLLFLGTQKLCRMLSILWQWLVVGIILSAGVLAFSILAWQQGGLYILLLILTLLCWIGLVCYCAYAFHILLAGVNIMAKGNLSHQVPTQYLVGSFREFALQLNALSGTALETAQKHTRSERMKTELITNVTHDIKTPLTSIINFVDLLQRNPSPEETRQYLEILSRQSLQMKHLIGDLIELSKATSGSLNVNLSSLDASETVNQALGEFADKLEAAQLTPVFRSPEESVQILADGRLAWRVLSNLLSNAVKYAMPGTRLYVDLSQFENTVLLSLKNVSRQSLNTSAEDLMERFIQGDTSRNTDGSGLGLNIAKTLMELMGGKLQLLIDGDLFKVTLVFPASRS
jgi:signal transduction histidine kinase